jgi:molecular chaperone GrpE
MNEDRVTTQADVPASDEIETSTIETPDLETQLANAQARADENYNKLLLAMADFENYKKRSERHNREIAEHKRRDLLKSLLPVIDNLERALASGGEDAGPLREGVAQTLKGFEALLASQGVKTLNVKGQPFDPAFAEAIATQPSQDTEDGVILEEAQKGYTIGDELLRPAKVIVAKSE